VGAVARASAESATDISRLAADLVTVRDDLEAVRASLDALVRRYDDTAAADSTAPRNC
jgi:hypothetical protein